MLATLMAVGDLPAAQEVLDELKKEDADNKSEYERNQRAIDLGNELLEKGEVVHLSISRRSVR
ncbi:MAG: hypothetical protein R3C11_05050 [Planctomycetaceae bacterium]